MNILYMEAAHHWSGGAKRLLLLARELRKRGHNVSFVCRPAALLGRFAALEGFPVAAADPAGTVDLTCCPAIARALEKNRADIADIPSSPFYRPGMLAARRRGSAVVLTRNVPFRKGLVRRLLGRRLYAGADAVVAVTDKIKEGLVQDFRLPADSITVVNDGVDLGEFGPAGGAAGENIRKELGLGGARVVGLVSRLENSKGCALFLEALPEVLRAVPGVKFVVAGVGRDEKKIRGLAASLAGKVVFAGFRQDVPALLSVAEATVMPSLNEGLPLCVLESLAASRPVAAFAGVLPEGIIVEGKTGALAMEHSPASLANAIIRMLNSDCSALGRQGRELIEEKFVCARMAAEMEGVYARALEKRDEKA